MLSVRQSSLDEPSTDIDVSASSWGHSGPGAMAATGLVHGACGAGGFQRRFPTGGAAYGMAKKRHELPLTVPCTGPLSVMIMVGASWDVPPPVPGDPPV